MGSSCRALRERSMLSEIRATTVVSQAPRFSSLPASGSRSSVASAHTWFTRERAWT